jgi:2-oxoglutarate ferredoxin oxidoreductase subunit gamma
VLFIGRLLAEAGILEDKEVTWLPYYGAEKRGGMCSCFVNISDEKVGSIFITRPAVAIVMSPAAMERIGPTVRTGGLLIVNESLIKERSDRQDIKTIYIPMYDMAVAMGDEAVGNLILLGALIANVPVVKTASLVKVINNMMLKNKRQLKLNKAALMKGCEFG